GQPAVPLGVAPAHALSAGGGADLAGRHLRRTPGACPGALRAQPRAVAHGRRHALLPAAGARRAYAAAARRVLTDAPGRTPYGQGAPTPGVISLALTHPPPPPAACRSGQPPAP